MLNLDFTYPFTGHTFSITTVISNGGYITQKYTYRTNLHNYKVDCM